MNRTKRILVDKFGIILWVFILTFTIWFNISVSFIDLGTNNTSGFILFIILRAFTIALFVLASLFFNRTCNFVYYQNGIVERRGFFFGFRKRIDASSIVRVDKIFLHPDGQYYVLYDGNSNVSERIRTNSALFIPCTRAGHDFIRLFWSGEIPDFE